MVVLVVLLVSAGLDTFDPKENVDVAVVAALEDVVELVAATEGDPVAVAPKLKLGVIEGPAGF